MTAEEILKQVRKIEINSKWLSNHVFSGQYRTAFKGTGVRFKEVREYQPGDDVRFIEWNVSARMGHPYCKVFEEERELPVYILADISGSTFFGTNVQSKKDLMIQLCADLCISVVDNNDKVGLILFSNKVEKYIPPKKKQGHVRYIIEELVKIVPSSLKTGISKALEFITNVSQHGSIVFIISDFADEGYNNALGIAARRHDIIGLKLFDKRDKNLPDIGLLEVKDLETGEKLMLNTSDAQTKKKFTDQFLRINNNTVDAFKKAGARLLQIETGTDYINTLQQFFLQKSK
jgi:uncharacterized protein (DUF58 family)